MVIPDTKRQQPIPDEPRDLELDSLLPPWIVREQESDFLDRLGQSLLKRGWMHPIRCMPELANDEERQLTGGREMFRTLTGWSRVRAAQRVGLRTGPGLILHRKLTETEILLDGWSENDLRSDTKEIDKYRILARLRELNGWSNLEIAVQTHGSAAEICKTFKRCELLPEELVALIGTGPGKLNPRSSYALSKLAAHGGDEATIRELAKKSIDKDLNVEALEHHIARLIRGRTPKRAKPVNAESDGARMALPGEWSWEKIQEFAGRLMNAARRGEKGELPTSVLSSLLKGK